MKTPKLSHLLHISALSLALGLAGSYAFADDMNKHDAEDGAHMQDSQQHGGSMASDPDDMDSTTRSGDDEMDDTNPAGTDATRSVPGAPEAGTNPATEPGSGSN